MALAYIAVGLIVFFYLFSKLRKSLAENDPFFTQVKFVQMYMDDRTEKMFYNKDEKEALELGQDVLWAAGQDFNKLMQYHVVEKQPLSTGDMSIVTAAIRIIKATEAIVHIKSNGPIEYYEAEPSNKIGH